MAFPNSVGDLPQLCYFTGLEEWADFVHSLPPYPSPTPVFDQDNWRDPVGGSGQVDKRPRSPDSGFEGDIVYKVHVTAVHEDTTPTENDSLDES